jgi:CheY-like chemotaxis protein
VNDQATVLVADDDPVTRLMLSGSLERSGHQVRTAENGAQALDLARSEPFDVVLLDVLMPELDGYGVPSSSRAIRSSVTSPS